MSPDKSSAVVINGHRLEFFPNETILDVAKRNGIEIPTLCFLERTTPRGVCGICAVEVSGREELVYACSTPAQEGMEIKTESARVVEHRKKRIAEMLSSGNHNCAIRAAGGNGWSAYQAKVEKEDDSSDLCPAWGSCMLQDLAYRYQVTGGPYMAEPYPYPAERVNPFIIRDFSRCVMCGRCVAACREIQVNDAITIDPEIPGKVVTTRGDLALKDSDCVFCGECIQVCPVGALVEKDSRFVRSWETQKVRTTCTYCGVGCQIILHVSGDRVVKVTGAEGVPPNYGSLCVKGRFGYDFIHSKDRLTTPLIKENGIFRKATWEEALDFTAKRLKEIISENGPDSVGIFTSARLTNEENYLANRFARGVIKTNNIDHCARL